MNETYLNCPSCGGAMSAEEYAAVSLNSERCSCGCEDRTACGRTQMVCCCREIPSPAPSPVPTEEEGCCCRRAFRSALRLLCDNEIADLLDFEQTAFITDNYVAGATVTETITAATPADNLVDPLSGIFRRFSPNNRDLLDITAPLNAVPSNATGLTVTQVSLCELIAVAIQLAEAEAEGDLTAEQVAQRNLRRVSRILSRQLTPCGTDCAGCSCSCPVGEDCCCAAGILSALAENNISRRVSLAAGPLLLNGVTLLGHVGNVLVLVNEEDQRFYFVCVNHIQFIA